MKKAEQSIQVNRRMTVDTSTKLITQVTQLQ